MRGRKRRTGVAGIERRSAILALACFLAPLASAATARAAQVRPAAKSDAESAALAEAAALLQKRALSDDGALETVRALTTEVGPRSAGSSGDRRAVAWAVARLAALGFENVRTEKVTVPHWVRGEAAAEIVAPWSQPLAIAALGGSPATPDGGLEAAVIETENLESLAKLPPETVRGKIVYFSERMQRQRDVGGYAKTVPIRGRGPVEAAKLGAVGVLIRSVGTDSHRLPHTGGVRYDDAVTKIPAAALSNPDADLLSREVASGKPVRVRFIVSTRREGDVESANVLADVPGSERPEEVILLVAHLDSWDLGTGALDDGAGVGIVTEAAKLIAALPRHPRRTVRVLLTANEEFGLSGARAYAEAHAMEMSRTVAAVEADLGAGPVFRFRASIVEADRPAVARIAPLLAMLGVDYAPEEPAEGGADLIPLAARGVPIFDLSLDATTYFDVHHTADDTFDKVDASALRQAVAAHATLAWALADLPEPLARTQPSPQTGR